MKSTSIILSIFLIAAFCNLAKASGESEPERNAKLALKGGWTIQASDKVAEKGEVLSTTRYRPKGWYPASVPTTVLNALLENKVYADPYYGMNLRLIPGAKYPIGSCFSNLPMPADSPFKGSWWYRREFAVPPDYQGKTTWLNFRGINFRANIWLNGRRIADASQVAGSFRCFEFDVTAIARPAAGNVLAVEVFPPQPRDLGITWVDVNPAPPDKDMGLWQEVYLAASGPVAVRHPQVVSRVDMPSLATAHLTVHADLYNASPQAVNGVLAGQIEGVQFQQEVEIGPRQWKRATFSPDKFPQLNFSHPRLWWPWQMGGQPMHEMRLEFTSGGRLSDRQAVRFGIREATSELTPEGFRLFRVNGRKILIRGAGWWSDMLLRLSPERQEAEMRYARDMHLNCLRMDGKFEDDHFLDLADQYGMLLMPGWCCGDHWEDWDTWKEEDYAIATACTRDRIRGFRNHPSILSWLNADDNPPPEKVARMYVNVLHEENWPNPFQASATGKPADVSGDTGLKMTGPYEYVPPAYWLTDKKAGGAFGFITETSPGAAIPPLDSLKKFLPAEHLWPIDEYWDYHAGGAVFKNIKVYTKALNARYGEASGVADFAAKAQVMDYEGQRAMYEAYGRNKYHATGVLQEMMNGSWPSVIWTLYDYYLCPGGGYFGTKKALEPVHIQYSYDDRSIVVVNSYYREFKGMKAAAKVYNLDMSEKFSRETALDIPSDGSTRVFRIPELPGLSATYFVRLVLRDSSGKEVSRNFYWLSTKPDVLDWGKAEWYYTPTKAYADLTALRGLPTVELKGAGRTEGKGDESLTHVTVENPTSHLAFFVHVRIDRGESGEEVLPVLWEDNYFELLPGEKRSVTATFRTKDLHGAAPAIRIEGWNVARP